MHLFTKLGLAICLVSSALACSDKSSEETVADADLDPLFSTGITTEEALQSARGDDIKRVPIRRASGSWTRIDFVEAQPTGAAHSCIEQERSEFRTGDLSWDKASNISLGDTGSDIWRATFKENERVLRRYILFDVPCRIVSIERPALIEIILTDPDVPNTDYRVYARRPTPYISEIYLNETKSEASIIRPRSVTYSGQLNWNVRLGKEASCRATREIVERLNSGNGGSSGNWWKYLDFDNCVDLSTPLVLQEADVSEHVIDVFEYGISGFNGLSNKAETIGRNKVDAQELDVFPLHSRLGDFNGLQ